METFDLTVIGAGPGGYPCAIRAAQLGARVAIVEREFLGGTCLNWGCIPTKTLIAGAHLLEKVRHAAGLGLVVEGASADYGKMFAHKNKVVGQLRTGVGALLKGNGVTVFQGQAAFAGRNRIRVTAADGSEQTLESARTVVATGSTSAVPGFLPRHERVVESRAFLDLEKLPKSLLVLGGGYIGCELAALAAGLGVKVTLVELLDDILLLLDDDLRKEVRRHMEKNLGIRILTGKALEKIEADARGVRGAVGDETVEAEMLLAAVGRQPVTDGLNLEAAGLTADEKGYVRVDEYGRTPVATVWAVGDVNGGMQLAHAATSQGVIVAENAITGTLRKQERLVPAVIFTSPEVALAGITEREAKEKGLEVKVGKFSFRALGRAMAAGATDGFVKWIADAKTDQLLGAAVVGEGATDLISEAALAIRSELTAEELGRTIHPHPTFGEIWMEAAHAVHGTCVHAPPARRK